MRNLFKEEISIDILQNSLFRSVTYIISNNQYPDVIVIDPGNPEESNIIRYMEKNHRTISHILLTHDHIDHVSGVNVLREKYSCCLVCTAECSQRIGDPRKNFSRYITGKDYICEKADLLWEELDDLLNWHGYKIRCIRTPGHSPASICIAFNNYLFTGDTIIGNIATVTKLPGGDKKAIRSSIDFIIESFSPTTIIYPGHGDPFLLRDVNREIIVGE